MSISSIAHNQAAPFALLAQRVQSQLEFAKMLSAWAPAKPQPAALASAEALAREVFACTDLDRVTRGVSEIESRLAPFAKLAKSYTIYCVGHAHIDMNWMWGWPETVAVTNDTVATVLKLMDEFPTFVFSQSQASIYRIIEEYNPALLDGIRRRVKEGRWEVTASHWVEGDRNMVSGESLTRHLLYTRKYLADLLDLTPEDVTIDWSPDTFGHPITVPMYLTRGGVRHVYLHRPGEVGTKRPHAFWWKSPDGSRVLVRNDMDNGYNGQLNRGIIHSLKRFSDATNLRFAMYVYGVGDHGGGPTRRDLAMGVEMNSWPIFPNIQYARARDFCTRLEAEGAKLPTLDCELNFELAGCYTTQSLIKRSNRIAEHRLLDAEVACTIASAATDNPYPSADLEQAWRDTLFSHFHDILPGSNVHDSRTWMHGLFQKTIARTSICETLALRALAAKINTSVPGVTPAALAATSLQAVLGAGVGWGSERGLTDQADNSGGGPRAIVLFNPTARPRTEIVEATIWTDVLARQITDELRARPMCVRTPDGRKIPVQKLEHGHYWGHVFVRIAFPAEIPALGYATYTYLEENADETPAATARQITAPYHCSYVIPDRRPEGLRNDLVEVVLDSRTGGIARLTDLRTNTTCSAPEPWRLEYLLEQPHGMTAWIIDNAIARENAQVLSLTRQMDGPYKSTVQVKLRVKQSDLTLTYELRAGDPRLYLHLNITWMERGTPQVGVPSLRWIMPLGLEKIHTTYEIPFGTIERDLPQNQEVPSLNVAMISGNAGKKPAGLLLLNDCKHGHSLDGQTFALTLIRSAYDPDPLPDVGQHEIHLAIQPTDGKCSNADAIAAGKQFNRPLRVVTAALQDGPLSPVASAIDLRAEGVLLTEVKRADDGSGVILRLVNPDSTARRATLVLNSALLGQFRHGTEVDLMERPLDKNGARLDGGKLTISVPANALASVKLTH